MNLLNTLVLLMALAVSLVCFAGLLSVESATAQNIQTAYVSLHGGGQ